MTFIIGYMITIILLFKIHYVIGNPRITKDVPIAIIAAIYFHRIAARYSSKWDRFLSTYFALSSWKKSPAKEDLLIFRNESIF